MHDQPGVTPCQFEATRGGWRCAACGRVVRSATAKPPLASCRSGPAIDAPSFLTKVKNFAVASAKHVAAGMPMASDEEILRRHDICQGCDFFKNNSCQKCGCPVSRDKKYVSKLSWADSECPVGKWGKEAASPSSHTKQP